MTADLLCFKTALKFSGVVHDYVTENFGFHLTFARRQFIMTISEMYFEEPFVLSKFFTGGIAAESKRY